MHMQEKYVSDLCVNDSYDVLKRIVEDRSAWRESIRMKVPKSYCTIGKEQYYAFNTLEIITS